VTQADFTKRDILTLAVVITFATILVGLLTWLLWETFVPSDPRDPLTKAGGLRPEQDIHRNK
jgi:hypothetical protein